MANIDELVKSHCLRHPGENRGPDVVPAKAGNHEQMTGFRPGFHRGDAPE